MQGLSQKGYEIHILSTEKSNNFQKREKLIREIIIASNINWHYISYTKKPPIISTLIDIHKLKKKAIKLHNIHRFKIIHCRSYISAFVGLHLKNKFGAKFIFDMRGFYADERVDGKIWNTDKFIFNKVFNFFKKKEKEFISNADYTISLTESAKNIISNWNFYQNDKMSIEVIPCCANLDTFSKNNIDKNLIEDFKAKNKITNDNFILSYIGSLGTWYMIDEMLDFFKVLKQSKPNAKFLFVTNDDTKTLTPSITAKGLNKSDFVFYSAERNEVPSLISLSDFSIFFILPTFSKKASSPTKMAEILAMGVPIICNVGVGDVDLIVKETNAGICVESLIDSEYIKAIKEIELFDKSAEYLRNVSENYFSLEKGVNLYDSVYKKLI